MEIDVHWTGKAWEHYLYWQEQDRKTLKRINQLIKDISRNGPQGLGKAEPLRYQKAWSRRIDSQNRLVFRFENDYLVVLACKGHYED